MVFAVVGEQIQWAKGTVPWRHRELASEDGEGGVPSCHHIPAAAHKGAGVRGPTLQSPAFQGSWPPIGLAPCLPPCSTGQTLKLSVPSSLRLPTAPCPLPLHSS